MTAFRRFVVRFVVLLSLGLSGAAFGQSGERGSIPPGTSQDGSRPSDGAIKGGAILPGETAGVPEKAPSRCDELQGTLREDCLKQERDAASGATKIPLPSERETRSPERAD
jgi:hypothetical protein